MKKWLDDPFVKIGGLFLGIFILLTALSNVAQGAVLSPKEAGALLEPSVGKLEVGNSEQCTVTKVGPYEFLTAAHCINRVMTEIKMEFRSPEGKYTWVTARSVTLGFVEKPKDKKHWEDWAIVHAKKPTPEIPSVPYACANMPQLGDQVAYMGFPWTRNTRSLTPLFAVGYISGSFMNHETKIGGHFTADMPGAGGSSGSAVLDLASGRIIGILTRVEVGDRDIVGVIAEHVSVSDLCVDGQPELKRYGITQTNPSQRFGSGGRHEPSGPF